MLEKTRMRKKEREKIETIMSPHICTALFLLLERKMKEAPSPGQAEVRYFNNSLIIYQTVSSRLQYNR